MWRFGNNPQTTLSAAITSTSATTLTVTSATRFPTAGDFMILIDDELMKVTGVSGATFTVVRAQEGTTAATHIIGAIVSLTITAAILLDIAADLLPIVTKTSVDYTFTDDDYVVLANQADNAFHVFTLPTPVGRAGRRFVLKRIDATAAACEITSAAGTIDGASLILIGKYESMEVVSDGANWHKVSHDNHPWRIAYVVKTNTAYTLNDSDYMVAGDLADGTNRIFTLPSPSGRTGRVFIIKKIDATAAVLSITTLNGSDTIDGVVPYTLTTQYQSVMIVSTGTGWVLV